MQVHESLQKMDFTRRKSDPGTYFKGTREEIIIILIYFKDAFVMGSNKTQVKQPKT